MIRPLRAATILISVALGAALLVALFQAIQASSSGEEKLRNEHDLRVALDTMPYDYSLHRVEFDGADQSYVGTVHGAGSSVDFAVSICGSGTSSCAVPAPPRASGVEGETGYGSVVTRTNPRATPRHDSDPPPPGKSGVGLAAAVDTAICHATGQDEYGCV